MVNNILMTSWRKISHLKVQGKFSNVTGGEHFFMYGLLLY